MENYIVLYYMPTPIQKLGKGMVKALKCKIVIPKSTRVCVYPKDVGRIMGKEYQQARLFLLKIKKHYNKEPYQMISLEEFCEYTGLKIEHVARCITT